LHVLSSNLKLVPFKEKKDTYFFYKIKQVKYY